VEQVQRRPSARVSLCALTMRSMTVNFGSNVDVRHQDRFWI